MPLQTWSSKPERQYGQSKENLQEHRRSEDVAEEFAARTVNKDRARHGEAAPASRTSIHDVSSARRLRSHSGPEGRTMRPALRKGAPPRDRWPLQDG